MNPHLDDLLEATDSRILKSKRKTLKALKEFYKAGSLGMISKPATDLATHASNYSFHIGCPNPELRTIASWMLTNCQDRRKLAKLIPVLWKRRGREDHALAGLLLANLGKQDLNEEPWMVFIHLYQKPEPLEMILQISEEMVRAGNEPPSDAWLLATAEQSPLWHQIAVLILSLRKKGIGTCEEMVRSAPEGGELFSRIRDKVLADN